MNIMYVSVWNGNEVGFVGPLVLNHESFIPILMEAAFITLIGGLIGVGCGYLLATVVGGYISITPIITPSIFAISTLVSVFTGIFSELFQPLVPRGWIRLKRFIIKRRAW